MNAHIFTPTAGSKSPCSVCGKTRNTKAHKDAKTALVSEEFVEDTEAKVAEALAADEAAAVAAAREDMLPEASAATDDAEIADALAALEVEAEELVKKDNEPWGIPPVPDFVPNTPEQQAEVEARRAAQAEATAEPAQEAEKAPAAKKAAPAKKAAKKGVEPNTVRLWVGWRITNAAVLLDSTKAQRTLAAKLQAAKPTSELDRYVRLTVDELRALDEVGVTFEAPGNTGPVIYSARTMRRRIAEAISTLENKGNDK